MAAPAPKRMRIRGKTAPAAQLAAGLARVFATAASLRAAMDGAVLPPDFLEAKDLAAEERNTRKQVYLATLPHPRHSTAQALGLKAPGQLGRQKILNIMLDICAHPVYDAHGVNGASGINGVLFA